MIKSFRCKYTFALFSGKEPQQWDKNLHKQALRKLLLLDAAMTIDQLRVPPGNQLEKLSGDRDGQWSIRINGQWRLCFEWLNGGAYQVEIIDYH